MQLNAFLFHVPSMDMYEQNMLLPLLSSWPVAGTNICFVVPCVFVLQGSPCIANWPLVKIDTLVSFHNCLSHVARTDERTDKWDCQPASAHYLTTFAFKHLTIEYHIGQQISGIADWNYNCCKRWPDWPL